MNPGPPNSSKNTSSRPEHPPTVSYNNENTSHLPKIKCPPFSSPSIAYLNNYSNEPITSSNIATICTESCIRDCKMCYTPYTCYQCFDDFEMSKQGTMCRPNKLTEGITQAMGLLVFVVIAIIVFGIYCYALRVKKLEGFEKD